MLIKLRDYELIYQTINGVLVSEGADPSVSCMFFSVFGAYILSQHYKIEAHPVAGLAVYNVGNTEKRLAFGEVVDGEIVGTDNAFHCWIIADGWHVDFMAPEFPKLVKRSGSDLPCPSKMLQKPISNMANSPYSLPQVGDFYAQADPAVTQNRLQYFSMSMAYGDLAQICSRWFCKPPKKMRSTIQIADGKGSIKKVSLTGRSVVGAW